MGTWIFVGLFAALLLLLFVAPMVGEPDSALGLVTGRLRWQWPGLRRCKLWVRALGPRDRPRVAITLRYPGSSGTWKMDPEEARELALLIRDALGEKPPPRLPFS